MLELLQAETGESAKQFVTRTLLYNITRLKLEPGRKIVESELCEKFHMSRTPIREALLELHQKGLIDIFPKRGTYVSYIDLEIIEEARSLRSAVEAELARIACNRLTAADIDVLRENMAVSQYYMSRDNIWKVAELDKKFHSTLYEMCKKDYWKTVISATSPHFDRVLVILVQCMQGDMTLLKDHGELLNAFESKDEEKAAELSKQHMKRYTEYADAVVNRYPDYFKK